MSEKFRRIRTISIWIVPCVCLIVGFALIRRENPSPQIVHIGSEGYSDAKWGMSKSQVEKIYPEMQRWEGPTLEVYYVKGLIDGREATIAFIFNRDILMRVDVTLAAMHREVKAYTADYEAIHKFLTNKYGKPLVNLPRDTAALGAGWKTKETSIFLSSDVASEQYHSTKILYASNEYGFPKGSVPVVVEN